MAPGPENQRGFQATKEGRMTWYWYVSRADELMLDLDGSRESRFGPTRLRLEAACSIIVPEHLWVFRSGTPGHYHVIVQMAWPMPDIERFVWEMQLRGDLFRGRCNIMRALYGHRAPGLLIAPKRWEGFRDPDAECQCTGKHNIAVMAICQAAQELRGEHAAASFFGPLPKGRKIKAWTGKEGLADIGTFARSELVDIDE